MSRLKAIDFLKMFLLTFLWCYLRTKTIAANNDISNVSSILGQKQDLYVSKIINNTLVLSMSYKSQCSRDKKTSPKQNNLSCSRKCIALSISKQPISKKLITLLNWNLTSLSTLLNIGQRVEESRLSVTARVITLSVHYGSPLVMEDHECSRYFAPVN